MNIGDKFEVCIERFSNLGFGIAKIDGQVVFVENSCPNDRVKIRIKKVTKNYAQAAVEEVISPSEYRVQNICALQKVCGVCPLGFIDYDYQIKLKQDIVRDAMVKIGQIETPVNYPIKSPKILGYRQKFQYPVSQTKNSKRLLIGYYKPQTHEIVNIKHCTIQPEICDKFLEFIREKAPEYNITGYEEKRHSGVLRHIVIRGSEYSNRFLITLVINEKSSKLNEFAKCLYDEFEEISGVCVNYNNKKTNVILSDKTECIIGSNYIEEKLLDKKFKIGANTFFQVNPKSAENIFKYVKSEVSKLACATVLDAYAGIAAFGIVVSDCAKKIVSVEENSNSIELAKDVLEMNNINNVELYAQDTLKYLKSIKKNFDITILDPPRKGCTQEVLEETFKHTKNKIIYVSCNPATLARDLKYLKEKGCKIESIQPFDMFCHTYHVETVAVVNV